MLIKNSIIIKNFKLILYSIIISAFLLRVILAIYYYFEGPLKFASEDAIKFHEIAIIFHDYGFTWDYFKNKTKKISKKLPKYMERSHVLVIPYAY